MMNEEWIIRAKGELPSEFWKSIDVLHRSVSKDPHDYTILARLKPGNQANEWQLKWSREDFILYILPNQKYQVTGSYSISWDLYDEYYYLDQIKAPEAWQVFSYLSHTRNVSKDVVVAIVDTGVDLHHPHLSSLLVPGVNIKNRSLPPQDHLGHGTKVAGVLSAVWGGMKEPDHPIGNGKIMPIKVLENGNDGDLYFTVEGMKEAIRRQANIIVLAQGSWTYSPLLAEVIEQAEEKGILVIGAAGNATYDLNGQVVYQRPIYYPAAFPTVVGVGSVRADERHEPSSNVGAGLDLVAPGELIKSIKSGGGTELDSGTSFSAPQVAGVAAFIWQLHPEYTVADVRNLLRQTADKVPSLPKWDESLGYGRLNAYRAVTEKPLPDRFEPNNSKEKATPISLYQQVTGELTSKDEDWYQLYLEYPGTLSLDFGNKRSDRKGLKLEIYLSNGKSAIYSLDSISDLKVTAPAGYIQLRFSQSDDRQRKIPYQFSASFLIEADLFENNDFPWNAYQLPLQEGWQSWSGTIHKKGDEDWFRFMIPKAGKLELFITPTTPRMDPVLSVLSQPGIKEERLDLNGEGEREEITLQVKAGSLIFRVSDYGSNSIEQPYHIRAYFEMEKGRKVDD
ncbi:subtilase family protein [Hazenella coriacea]|uniref:Subtilase family protein n=2 Tax=Hazenella coriacea TaxID=1179467 RepID=A0A4R3L963_9BACL|nr:subtilase family protein [Hazenella coriacea]